MEIILYRCEAGSLQSVAAPVDNQDDVLRVFAEELDDAIEFIQSPYAWAQKAISLNYDWICIHVRDRGEFRLYCTLGVRAIVRVLELYGFPEELQAS